MGIIIIITAKPTQKVIISWKLQEEKNVEKKKVMAMDSGIRNETAFLLNSQFITCHPYISFWKVLWSGSASKACRSGSVTISTNCKTLLYFSRKFQCTVGNVKNIENYDTYDADEKDKQLKLALLWTKTKNLRCSTMCKTESGSALKCKIGSGSPTTMVIIHACK